VTATSALNSTTPKSVTVACPGTKRALGGGAVTNGAGGTPPGQPDIVITESQPTMSGATPTGWAATAQESDGVGGSWSVTVVALCATVAP
jgi:hypothetical protein